MLRNIANRKLKKYCIPESLKYSIEIQRSERADLANMSTDFDFIMKRLEASMHTPYPKFR